MTVLPAGDVELATGFTVADYLAAVERQNRPTIADAVHRRFRERYLDPISYKNAPRHGFTMMAVACLMIEALVPSRMARHRTERQGRARVLLLLRCP